MLDTPTLTNPDLQTKFNQILAAQGDKEAFFANPVAELQNAGIPVLPTISVPAEAQHVMQSALPQVNLMQAFAVTVPQAEVVKASTHWWGVDIYMNEKMTSDIVNGITAAGPAGSAIAAAFGAAGVMTGGVATAIGAGIGAICAAKVAQIKITDNGKGVHWPISWLQWAALVAAAPTGPASVLAAGMVFLHPLWN